MENASQNENGRLNLSDEEMENICRKVDDVLKTEKLYLIHDFSLWDLGRAVKISPRKVSWAINHHSGDNFYNLITRLRMEEAKELIREKAEKRTRLKYSEIAAMSGYRSRSSFYTQFAQCVGTTPKQYAEKLDFEGRDGRECKEFQENKIRSVNN